MSVVLMVVVMPTAQNYVSYIDGCFNAHSTELCQLY
jgi:hypothetical protein